MARSHSTRSSYSSFLRQLRPGAQRGSKARSADNKPSSDYDQHARISKCLVQAREGQLFELLRLVRSLTLANISTPATANLATQGNSVRILSACRQPPAGVLAALTAGQLDSSAHGATLRALWGLMPFKLTSSSAKGATGSIPCDAEPQTIGAVYSRLSNDPLWLLSASSDPPTSFGLMLEARPRRSIAERDAEQCVLEFAQLAEADVEEGAAKRWRRAALARAKHAVGLQLGQGDVIRRWQEQEEEQQEEDAQAMYAFASAASTQDGGRAASSRNSSSMSAALSDADAAQLMYAYASLVADSAQGARQGQRGNECADEEVVHLLQLLAGLAGEGAGAGSSRAAPQQPRRTRPLGQDTGMLHKYVQLS